MVKIHKYKKIQKKRKYLSCKHNSISVTYFVFINFNYFYNEIEDYFYDNKYESLDKYKNIMYQKWLRGKC